MWVSMRKRRILAAVGVAAIALGAASCRREPQADHAQRLHRGQRYLEEGKFPQAAIEFRAAIQLAPRDPDAYYLLGLAYLADGNIMNAVPALVKAAEVDPKHAGSQLKLAELLSASKDPKLLEEAQQRARQVLAAEPGAPDALTVLALTEAKLGDAGSAERHLREALKGAPGDLKAAGILARLQRLQADAAGAEQTLRSLVEKAPKSPEAHLQLAEFYLTANRLAEAEKEIQVALSLDQRNARAMLALAAVYALQGRQSEMEALYQKVSRLGDPKLRHLYGAFLFSQGRREEAIREFQQAVRDNPGDRDARSRLVAAYLITNRPEDAKRVLTAALAKNPRDVDALLQHSELDLRAGDPGAARARLLDVLRYKPDSAPAHFLLAKTYALRGEKRLQRDELSQTLNLRPDLWEARLALSRSMAEDGSTQAALDILEQAPPAQKESLEYVVLRNHLLLALGRLEECAAAVAQALAKGPAPDLLVQDGELKFRAKKYAAALGSYEAALRLNPSHLGAMGGLFRAVAAQKGVPAGLEALRRYAASHPKSAPILHYAGERLLAGGQRAEARRMFEAALAVDKAYFQAELSLARLDLTESQFDRARTRLLKLRGAGVEPVTVRLLLATLETQAQNFDVAIEHYAGALDIEPGNVQALTNLAYLLAEYKNRQDEALNYAQRAREADPDNPDAAGVVGWIYYRKGVYGTALEYLRDAVTKQRNPVGAAAAFRQCYLGLTYLKLGERLKASEALREALAAGPDPRHMEIVLSALREAGGGSARKGS